MINTLALFLSPEERCQSRSVTIDPKIEYESDLFVQGILMVFYNFVLCIGIIANVLYCVM